MYVRFLYAQENDLFREWMYTTVNTYVKDVTQNNNYNTA